MYDHRRKLEWARKHLDGLNESIRVFHESTPCHLTIKFNPENRAYEGFITQLKPLNPDWNMMLGDIVYGLRSSLDNLVYALVVEEQGFAPTEYKVLRDIQFPICRTSSDFKGQAYRIRLVSDLAKTGIESLQPYNTPIPGEHHPLVVLNDLANIDKHRHIILTYPRAESMSIAVSGPGLPEGTRFGGGFSGPIEEGTFIGGLTIRPFDGWPGIEYPLSEMNVKPDLALDILLRAGSYEVSVAPYLGFLCKRIEDVFAALEKFLPPSSAP